MNIITVTVPIPDKRLNPNNFHGNTKYAAIARTNAKRKSRRVAELLCISEMNKAGEGGKWISARVVVTWYARTAATLDRDNARAMLKSALDGFTRAGLWVDDKDVDIVEVKREKDKTWPRVELRCERKD